MEQKIEIKLEEYKELRSIVEEYNKLLGEYNMLVYVYQQLVPQPRKEKVKEKIGFK